MIDVRKVVNEFLTSLHPRVYFQVANEKAAFPYIVFDIPSIFCDGERFEVVTLDVEGWDSNNTNNTYVIEELMNKINALDKKVLATENISVAFYLESKLPIQDDDKRIKRRRYTYTGRLIRR